MSGFSFDKVSLFLYRFHIKKKKTFSLITHFHQSRPEVI